MATHSSTLAWRIPGTGEPGGLPSLGSHRVGQDWSDLAAAAAAYQSNIKSFHKAHKWAKRITDSEATPKSQKQFPDFDRFQGRCQKRSLTWTDWLPWKFSFCVQSSAGNQFLLSPLPPKAGLTGLCFSNNLSSLPAAFHCQIPPVKLCHLC